MAYEDEMDELLDELSGDYDDDDDVAVGAEEIIGLKEIIGKMGRGRGRRGLAARMGRLRNIDPNAVVLKDSGPGPRRVKVLPGPITNVGAGATVDITFTTQEHFRPERFFVEDANAGDFRILSVKVGTEEQFVSSGAAPGSMFTADSADSYLHFKTLNPGNELTVRVQNTSAGALDFIAAFKGTAVD